MAHLYNLLKSKSCLLLILFALASGTINANTYYVDTVGNSGPGSLRAAIDSANAHPGADSIVLQLSVQDTIYLASPLPNIQDTTLISGLPCQNPTISGGLQLFNGSAFHSTSTNGALTLNYINVINCIDTAASAQGAAVKARHINVNNCFFAGNQALANTGTGKGGAIYAIYPNISNATFYNNAATNSTSTAGAGGALFANSNAGLSNCTFDNNTATTSGGAVISDSASLITNCTFVYNSAGTNGGAIWGINLTVVANSIVWGNTAVSSGSGVYLSGAGTSGGCNVLQASLDNANFTTQTSDIEGTNPMLDTLGYFNGCVPVVPIFCGSVAQNHASCTGATTTDAQGVAANGIRDAGAFEIIPPNLGGDTIDSIQHGTTADLLTLFNTTGLTFSFSGNYTDSTQVDTGTYTIIAYNYLGCADTAFAVIVYSTDTTTDTTTAIRTISEATAIGVFPNPAHDRVTLTFNQQLSGAMQLKVFDATGGVVLTQNMTVTSGKAAIDISGFSNGLYYAQITDTTGRFFAARLNVLAR